MNGQIETKQMQEARVLIADDNVATAKLLSDYLAAEVRSCEVATNHEHALELVRKLDCDIAICDTHSYGTPKFELLEHLKTIQPDLPVIVGADAGSIVDAVEAVRRGAYQYVEKPFIAGDLLRFISEATAEPHRHRKTVRPPRQGSQILSGDLTQVSLVMRELVESIALVARSNAPVLILGETGTGKERVAHAIHIGGPRASLPFVAVNTSAIPEPLLESEIFGHVRGAFTGATQARRGLLLEANGGTLLLDEIGDMPIMLQPKLLRVLQFGESRPVGSDRLARVDVRVVAATHRDISALVAEGRFREDLHYRLNVITLIVPPLRDRREDIGPLVVQFLGEARLRTIESPVRRVSDEAMSVLIHAAWPGNVRELENAVERLVVLGREAVVNVRDLAFLQAQPLEVSWPGEESTPWTLKEMHQRYLDWVLSRTEGDKVRAAAILDVNLSTLYRWARAKR